MPFSTVPDVTFIFGSINQGVLFSGIPEIGILINFHLQATLGQLSFKCHTMTWQRFGRTDKSR
jgi:hypothetical protein